MVRKFILVITLALACMLADGLLLSRQAAAGFFEFSLGFSFNKRNYFESNYSWNRRWGLSVGYNFNERSGIELAVQDVVDRTKIEGLEDTTFHDQIYSFNWIQSFLGRNYALQPYAKVGVGQLNRSASGNYADGGAPPAVVDSITGILAAGTRIYLTKTIAFRTEATTYLSGGSIRTWRDNVALEVGLSMRF